MHIHWKRIKHAQKLMQEHNLIAIMIMNHDDYRYFFGEKRVQPRALILASGDPVLISFQAEEQELKDMVGDAPIKIFSRVGEQIKAVFDTLRSLLEEDKNSKEMVKSGKKPKVGMQLLFDTPAFLVDLFRRMNKKVELVSSDPVMDELRMVKEPEEIEQLTIAQEIAGKGMDRIKELLRPGITGHELATEALYTMMKEGAEGTSTPIHINNGIRSAWIHGKFDKTPIKEGELIVVNLTPQYDGYCANLARTFVIGKASNQQRELYETYLEMRESTRQILKPGIKSLELDVKGKEICTKRGLEKYHINGISHGIGLRFEENPASTIIPTHRSTKLKENMTMTIGHTILAISGYGGVRLEDIYLVTPIGGEILHPYPDNEWEV